MSNFSLSRLFSKDEKNDGRPDIEVTPIVKWGGLFLIGVAFFLGIEKISGITDQRSSEVDALQTQKSALLRVSEAPDVSDQISTLATQISDLEGRYFRESTDGLNSASLQTLVARIFNDCGMKNVSIALKIEPSEADPQTGAITATIKGRDSDQRIATCVSALRQNAYAFEIVSLNWLRSGATQMEVRSFYLPPEI